MNSNYQEILKQYWGYDTFRPLQEDIVRSVVEGNDTLALLPTGGGKSICFQVPALALGGLCLVISPLIALMKDQVANLKKRNIKAAALFSGMSNEEIENIISNCLFDKEYRFLYVSPERLKTDRFLINLKNMPISMIAVDEAHCISQWGYDFRPPYLEIAEIRQFFPKAPVLALTATATPEVVKDIQKKLNFSKENLFQKSFKRDNLTYMVVKEDNKLGRILRFVNRYEGTGIIYVRNRAKTEEIASYLRQNGISADSYNAGLDAELRDRKQNSWMSGKTRIIVSTNAFGMGIDKPDVRFVLHYGIPDTLEAYFQEAGRGGRDLKPSIAVLFYDDNDINELKKKVERDFPPLETIRNLYKSLCNYYNIGIGEGENENFPFPITIIAEKMNMKIVDFRNALSFLEKIGVISVAPNLKNQSAILMKMNNESLHYFYSQHADKEDFVKLLLRSYGGVFTKYTKIYEEEIAQRAEMPCDEVVTMLKKLNSLGVLSYQERSDKIFIVFLQNRIPEHHLYFSDDVYKLRKKVALQRMEAVLNFIQCNCECRSRLLLSYFGEKNSTKCGSCDVCRKIDKAKVEKEDFESILRAVTQLLQISKELSPTQIVEKLSGEFNENKLISVVRTMMDHGLL